jgi:hypothetical protein
LAKRAGGVIVVRDPNTVKKPYIAPSFQVVNAAAARKQLEENGATEDEDSQKMLSVLTQNLKQKKVS